MPPKNDNATVEAVGDEKVVADTQGNEPVAETVEPATEAASEAAAEPAAEAYVADQPVDEADPVTAEQLPLSDLLKAGIMVAHDRGESEAVHALSHVLILVQELAGALPRAIATTTDRFQLYLTAIKDAL